MRGEQYQQNYPSWDDPSFRVKSDSRWVAQYRALQSWYRETVLQAPPGEFRGKLRGNRLDEKWLEDHPDANFLNAEIAGYVATRTSLVQKMGGTLEEERLRGNLMSSQPLCFNLFGYLRNHMEEAAAPFARAFGLDIAVINQIEVEVPKPYLGDRTAFDAYIEYQTSDGRSGFIGVETKYTEKFSPQKIYKPRYREVTNWPDSGFKKRSTDALVGSMTNQLWRNALLTVSHRKSEYFDFGHVAVAYCDGDRGLDKAIGLFRDRLEDEDSLLRAVSYQDLLSLLNQVGALKEWSADFQRRYLDLTIIGADAR